MYENKGIAFQEIMLQKIMKPKPSGKIITRLDHIYDHFVDFVSDKADYINGRFKK